VRIRFYKLFIVLTITFFTRKSHAQSLSVHSYKPLPVRSDSIHMLPKIPLILQRDSYVKNLAFFCRQELKLEKALKVPFRFRVGLLEQCNLLEGKK